LKFHENFFPVPLYRGQDTYMSVHTDDTDENKHIKIEGGTDEWI